MLPACGRQHRGARTVAWTPTSEAASARLPKVTASALVLLLPHTIWVPRFLCCFWLVRGIGVSSAGVAVVQLSTQMTAGQEEDPVLRSYRKVSMGDLGLGMVGPGLPQDPGMI